VGDTRRFTDSFGFQWQVVEIEGDATVAVDRGAARRGWLYFFSRGATRVLRDYPVGWRELAWSELEQLCAQGVVVGSDRPWRHWQPAPGGDVPALRA
jgi:hypothetical protein